MAHATFSEKQRGWERQVRSEVAVAGAGGLWEPLAVRTEVGRAGWGTPSIQLGSKSPTHLQGCSGHIPSPIATWASVSSPGRGRAWIIAVYIGANIYPQNLVGAMN